VRRLPQLPVAGYSLLLLAILSSGFQRTAAYLPLPKGRRKSIRPSLLDLLALLRNQIFAPATDAPLLHFDDFADARSYDPLARQPFTLLPLEFAGYGGGNGEWPISMPTLASALLT
jgi:hypothetical protein